MNNPKMMQQIAAMQQKMEKIQSDLAQQEVTGTAGGGVVSVTCDGQQKIRSVVIAPEALEEGAEMVADLVLAACNEALEMSRKAASDSMGQLTAGLNLPPGLF
jgi:DNA-binding YbaB/EbfC family protein